MPELPPIRPPQIRFGEYTSPCCRDRSKLEELKFASTKDLRVFQCTECKRLHRKAFVDTAKLFQRPGKISGG